MGLTGSLFWPAFCHPMDRFGTRPKKRDPVWFLGVQRAREPVDVELLYFAIYQRDSVGVLSTAMPLPIYLRNLYFRYTHRAPQHPGNASRPPESAAGSVLILRLGQHLSRP